MELSPHATLYNLLSRIECGTTVSVSELSSALLAVSQEQRLVIVKDRWKSLLMYLFWYSRNQELTECLLNHITPENRQELVMMKDDEGMTSLHWASRSWYAKTSKYILDSIAPENRQELVMIKDSKGNTPLHTAVSGWVFPADLSTIILQHLNPQEQLQLLDATNNEGETIADIAISRGHSSVVDTLNECRQSAVTSLAAEAAADVQTRRGSDVAVSQPPTLASVFNPPQQGMRQFIQNSVQAETSTTDIFSQIPNPSPQWMQTTTQPADLFNSSQAASANRTALFQGHSSAFSLVRPALEAYSSYHKKTIKIPPASLAPIVTEEVPSRPFNNVYPWEQFNHQQYYNIPYTPVLPQDSSQNSSLLQPGPSFSNPPPTTTTYIASNESPLYTTLLPKATTSYNTEVLLSPPQAYKRTVPIDLSNQQADGPLPAKNTRYEGKIEGETVELKCNNKWLAFMFSPAGTIGELTSEVERITGCTCTVHKEGGCEYTNSVKLRALTAPFIVSVGNSETFIKPGSSPAPATVSTSGVSTSARSDAARNQPKKFGRMSNAEQVIELFTFVHEQVMGGKSIHAALKLTGKDRKTIDRFRDLYYLHVTDSERLKELDKQWHRNHKRGALPALCEMARREIDWTRLKTMVDEGNATLFGGVE